ncbi:N-acetylglucosamine-6-phosphate deacetylase [Pelagibacterium halotolerans]|uniref:N-acetylglucosamine-6-phosphate deacetylase n=1 Tax=Pelagibacterium halotolerans (strain DSM 22347 / JCM 15775 / CGMCC 1.7692 / B2) TaxID=1082931 RepID=G4RDY6_PELHB|nr:N-acetylglucosamine-6-phosphate deacetylase [Pelagibacterium halotolerans]AEQ53898.1 N-acetylglucosamine-6-phosphate deacetylase [Pelagibacterium halotolerans B2]QJR19958.1 N-acetylglucosamine-6-phosphate deacetylase [Pelagibacterium halotolerans]SEA46091.1 N-acetylglucosamine-6-phosphate deacetylase [Pelagibacterium halotolerans]
MTMFSLSAPKIFDGQSWHEGRVVLVEDDRVKAILHPADVPDGTAEIDLGHGMLVPGFIDLQVNGAGGVLFNEDRSVGGLQELCAANFQFGTTALLPTLVTDTREVTRQALDAGMAASAQKVPGFIGLHIEGPHLSVARKGAHNPDYVRPMDEADLLALLKARQAMPALLTTVAVESVGPDQIARLAQAGVTVSLGHSDTGIAGAVLAFEAGATMVTHLFNAMSQLGNREPGLVGAALANGVWAGLIADGIHVDPATIGIALRAKRGPGKVFLVTDAMSPMGTDMTGFTLNGRDIVRADGALRLADGTLAGADLTMIDAVAYMHRTIGLDLAEVLRMASLYPARAIGLAETIGHLGSGAAASMVHLSDDLGVEGVWVEGDKVFG